MSERLFVIEGTDGSGKSTQFALLDEALTARGVTHRTVRFPRYGQPSAAMLEMYLRGGFGADPESVNPYAASSFFAMDRYASFQTDWREDYLRGVPVLCDRYTTSNAVHQASKLPPEQAAGFLKWLFDYEYRLLGLPEPTQVFFLDMPTEHAVRLLHRRQGDGGDIHERDTAYLAKCRERALEVCRRCGWELIRCAEGGRVRPAEEIHAEILEKITKTLGV